MKADFVKIINAAYKLSEFFPDGDPLKNKVRDRALVLMEKLTLLARPQYHGSANAQIIIQALEDIGILENYFQLAKYQDWVDAVNFLIIKKEYGLIAAELQSSLPVPKLEAVKTLPMPPDNEPRPMPAAISAPAVRRKEIAPKKHSPRQAAIVQMLKKGKKMQVKDIILQMPDVTKRTIRRDLDELLKQGDIQRVGEFNQIFYIIGNNNLENQPNEDRTVLLS